jgi:hypothetical protein
LNHKVSGSGLIHQQSLVLEQSRRLEGYRQAGHFLNHVVVFVQNSCLGNQQVVELCLAHLLDHFVFNFFVIVDKAEVAHTSEGASFDKVFICALTNTKGMESCFVVDLAVLLDKIDNSAVVVYCTIGQQVNVGFLCTRFTQVDLREDVNKRIVNFCAPKICFKLGYL